MRLVVALLVGGCDAVFGLPALDGPGDALGVDAPPDAPVSIISGRLRLHYATNQANFTPMIVEQIYPAASVTMSVVHGDGSTSGVVYDETTGAFSFPADVPGEAYRLRITTPNGTVEDQYVAPHLELLERLAGRPDRVPVTLPTTITFQLGAPTAGTAIIYSTGLWTQTGTTAVNTGNFAFDWHTAGSTSGTLGLLDAARYDVLYYTEVGGTTYDLITGLAVGFVTLVDGVAITFPGGVTPVAPNRCAHVVATSAAESRRMTTAWPRAYYQTSANWQIVKVPSLALGAVGAMWLAIAGQVGPVSNIDVTPTFYDPFPGDLLAEQVVYATFTFALPGATAVPVSNVSQTAVPLDTSTGSCNDLSIVQATVGLADTPALANMQLATDGQSVPLDLTRPVPLAWSLAADGPVALTSVLLYELKKDTGATGLHFVAAIHTVGTSVVIDPTLLVAGHAYAIALDTSMVYPNAAAGDFATIAPPFEHATTWSHYFVVQAI